MQLTDGLLIIPELLITKHSVSADNTRLLEVYLLQQFYPFSFKISKEVAYQRYCQRTYVLEKEKKMIGTGTHI